MQRREFFRTVPALAELAGLTGSTLAPLGAQVIGPDRTQVAEVYELQAAFHRAYHGEEILSAFDRYLLQMSALGCDEITGFFGHTKWRNSSPLARGTLWLRRAFSAIRIRTAARPGFLPLAKDKDPIRVDKHQEKKMICRANIVTIVILVAVAACQLALAQQPATATLTVDLTNQVEYQGDIYDPAKFARNASITPSLGNGTGILNFGAATILADIVAVNGQPAKGLYAAIDRWIATYPAPVSGQAIADVRRGRIREFTFEILQPDGTAIGSIMGMGLAEGDPPPGQPSTEKANWAITGGTGAFLGARGQVEGTGASGRAASVAEDPANRRLNGGSPNRYLVHLIPMTIPQIVTNTTGPAITHSSDFSLVNGSKPAVAGEILSLFATGLGPLRGAVAGQAFPSLPIAAVNSPVEVIVNGTPAEVLGAVGYPGAVDGYQVNFRVPADITKGSAAIQVSSAWTASAPVNIPVQPAQ